MRVTIATRIYAPEPAAAAFRLSALAAALATRGFEVVVRTSTPPRDSTEPASVEGVDVRRAPVLRDARGQVRGYLQYLSFDVPLLFRLLFAGRSAAVVVEPPPTSGAVVRLACALRRTPYVYYAADIWSDAAASAGAPGWVVRGVRSLERWALRGASTVIAVSDGVAQRVREITGDREAEVVRNGIDTDVFAPDGEQALDAPSVVYAGTTSEWQGAEVFIEAMPRVLAAVPTARLVYVGQGTAWDSLRELAARTVPTAVDFVDAVPPAKAAEYLRSARVGAVSLRPGQGYDFAVPTKIFAALGCGTPVLFAGRGASVDVLTPGLGRAVDWDAGAVAEAIIEMLGDESTVEHDSPERRSRARWAREHASIAATGRAAADLVEAVTPASPSPAGSGTGRTTRR